MKHFSLPQLPQSFVWIVVSSVITLISFAAFTAALGGDALNGKIEEGHYYVRGVLRDSQGGVLYKEVSRSAYVASASLCLLASIAFFLIGNRVLHLLEKQGILKSEKKLRTVLNVFWGMIFGSVAIYSVVTIGRALS